MPIPTTMRAAAIERVGPPRVLMLHELPVPDVGPNQVLIALHTAGVGSWDAEMRAGWWPGKRPPFPIVLGTDGAGTVAKLGARVRRFRLGQRVWAYEFGNRKGGFYAEYVAVSADAVAPIPRSLDLREAGAATVTGLTALQGIEALQLKRGESLIVHGASGGVGTLAVQFAKLRGARVLASASGKDGVRLAKRLGADEAVDGKSRTFASVAREFAPDGVDAVLALTGGPSLKPCLDALREGGRVIYPNGVEPKPRKRRGIRLTSYDAEAGPREFERLRKAVEGAHLQVPIDETFALEDAAAAHERIEAGHVLGKIVLKIRR